MNIDFTSYVDSLLSGVRYIPNTLKLIFIPLLLGLIIGTFFAYLRFKKVKVVDQLIAVFVTVKRGIPITISLLLLNLFFILFYGKFMEFFHLEKSIQDISIIGIAVFSLTLSEICLIEEAMRTALLSLDKGQWEAAKSIGMTEYQTVVRVIIPQLIPVALPNLTNIFLGLIKNSSIVVVIGVVDIMVGCVKPADITYRYFEAYLAAATIYWFINIIFEAGLRQFEKYSKRFRREVK